jgi:dephospho-CoA kinase
MSDKEKLNTLNSIVHPAVRRDHKDWHKQQKAPYTIREAAILFESGAYQDCDKIITVSAPEEIRIERVMKRDGLSTEDVKRRMSNQWSDKMREEKSDYVINNDGKTMLLPRIIEIHKELTSL